MKHWRITTAAIVGAVMTLAPAIAAAQGSVNVYTTREPGLIQPLFTAFTAETGITVNPIFVQSGLAERVAAEGVNSPADILMVVDYGELTNLVARGLTQSVQSDALNAAIPSQLRDPAGHWYTLSMRARVFYVDAAMPAAERPTTYEELADPRWRGRVCIRSGQHPYNTSLFAAMIAKHGVDYTRTYLAGLKANLARVAAGGDRDGARDILAGICDVAIANSYYVGLMRSGAGGAAQQQWGAAIDVVLPTFSDGAGTHVNISGAAVAVNAPNRANAVRLMEYLVSPAAQQIYAEANFEYPVTEGAVIHPIIAALGTLVIDTVPLAELGAHRIEASRLVDEVGFDN